MIIVQRSYHLICGYFGIGLIIAGSIISCSDLNLFWGIPSSNTAYTTSDAPQTSEYYSSWMEDLPDTTRLMDMSMPGTHNSAARYGNSFVKNQSWNIADQLRVGVRYFDIRIRAVGEHFDIYHGPVYQQQSFDDVLDEMTTFLGQYPSEALVLRIRQEWDAIEGSEDFESIFFNRYMESESYREYFYEEADYSVELASVRGKIFFMLGLELIDLADYHQLQGGSSLTPERISYKFFPGPGMLYEARSRIQDRYEVYPYEHEEIRGSNWASISSKKKVIKEFIDLAESQFGETWVLNYLSGTSIHMIPAYVASITNTTAYEYIGPPYKRKLGVIIMDFPGELLIQRIIATNFHSSP